MLRRLLARLQPGEDCDALYRSIVAQARQPAFYGGDGVPDTPEGRFELLVLHAALTMRRLRRDGTEGRDLAQALFDLMFRDLDRNLREMGVYDLVVPKRIRKMGEAFYGRAAAYDAGLDAGDDAVLADALARNLFDGRAGAERLRAMVDYVRDCDRTLAAAGLASLAAGEPGWPPAPGVSA